MTRPHVFVAISGGVDSSVSAALLQRQGYACSGVFMVTHDRAQAAQTDAQRVCDHLGIELHVLDLQRDFQSVIDYFCETYRRGHTPNPCVYCNRAIKFGVLWNFARSRGADFIATGHYAAIRPRDGQPALYAARDSARDQSYVLSMIRREVLGHILMPMADLSKDKTRQIAAELGLHTQNKKDSQEICFIPDNDYAAALRRWRPDLGSPGRVIDTSGRLLGEHDGIHRFTIGQRRGLGIALGKPAYVVKIDAAANTVTLGSKDDLMSPDLRVVDMNWLIDPPKSPFPARVKIRYNHKGSPATVAVDDERPDRVRIEFDRPVSAVTPGQAAVIYLADGPDWLVAGGGWIEQTTENRNDRTS